MRLAAIKLAVVVVFMGLGAAGRGLFDPGRPEFGRYDLL